MRHYRAQAADLALVALSPFLALLIRDNFVFYPPRWEAIIPYAAITVASATIVFGISGLHKTLWQYTSLPDVLRIIMAVTIALLLALFVSFVDSRLENVARSIPVIQWLLLISALVGTRLMARIWHERAKRDHPIRADAAVHHVLIVGVSHLTELYLESMAEYAAKRFEVVGMLSDKLEFRGRLLRRQTILGTPEELPRVMAQLDVHGIIVDRIVVMQPLDELSGHASEALLEVERASSVKVDWLVERLGFMEGAEEGQRALESTHHAPHLRGPSPTTNQATLSLGSYGYVKRVFDVVVAVTFAVALAPVACLIALLVACDVGFPLVFWQKRPGRFGHPFKLFKFCTMRAAHDAHGNRIADEERSSSLGHMLRRTRLDELPQLYNILIGEMSFVGPRPLLPVDQPVETGARLLVRPGLTGLAQVHGGRNMSAADKNTLDVWYVQNASVWLDVKILLRTPIAMVRGEWVDHYTLRAVQAQLERVKTQDTAKPGSYALTSKGVLQGGGQVEIAHPVI
jgi:lipopolysaccharide/colanic/teichoic acid biosynthesis glycosyltransferase